MTPSSPTVHCMCSDLCMSVEFAIAAIKHLPGQQPGGKLTYCRQFAEVQGPDSRQAAAGDKALGHTRH